MCIFIPVKFVLHNLEKKKMLSGAPELWAGALLQPV